jgi:putative hydrolase
VGEVRRTGRFTGLPGQYRGGMTNLPFGFGRPGDDDPQGSGGSGQGPGGFDLGQLGSMLSQLGQMMSQAGASGQTGPVNYDLAKRMATSQIPASHPASQVDVAKVAEAVKLAEVWLDGATALPAGTRSATAWTPRQWVDATMPMWEKLSSPIAERVSTAWIEGLPEEARAQAGPLLAMMGSMGGMAFGSQLGQGLAQLAVEVLTSTDVGVPLGPDGTAALLPRAIAEFASGLALPEDRVQLYLAVREAAHHRLYVGVPWLRDRVLSLIDQYASAITVDFSAVEEAAASIDPNDPASIQAALGQGLFEPKVTDAQRAAMVGLETLLALVEGWVDTVVADAVGDRLPGAEALRETLRRRRATGGPAEQTFATLIGLELRPRRLRAAAELWQLVGQSRGTDGRDALWASPDLLPSSADLDDPAGFAERDREFAELLAGLDDLPELSPEGGDGDPVDGAGSAGPAAGDTPAEPPHEDGPQDPGSGPRPV